MHAILLREKKNHAILPWKSSSTFGHPCPKHLNLFFLFPQTDHPIKTEYHEMQIENEIKLRKPKYPMRFRVRKI